PNSEVKQNSVDDSVDYPCESRTSPGPNKRNPLQKCDGFFAMCDLKISRDELTPTTLSAQCNMVGSGLPADRLQ
ncbi:hypothetical protein, partial [Pseudoalteromonas sp. CO348]|uniref:hypothetical protein n=1 Tax=Pseudoalteromonas sp. CO348 TaxID=1777271 RepID=UPI00198097E7